MKTLSLLLFGIAGAAMVTVLVWAEVKKAKLEGMVRTKAHLAVRGTSGALLITLLGLITWAVAFPPRTLHGMAWLITGIMASLFLLLVLAVLDARMIRRAGRRRREELLSALKEGALEEREREEE